MAIPRDRTAYDRASCRTPANLLALAGKRWTRVSTATMQERETCNECCFWLDQIERPSGRAMVDGVQYRLWS